LLILKLWSISVICFLESISGKL